MDGPVAEMNTCMETGQPSSAGIRSETDAVSPVRAEVHLSETAAPHQNITPEILDPLGIRFQYPCQLTYQDYLVEPQSSQYHLLTCPGSSSSGSSHRSSISASWFSEEPILCSRMGDVHQSAGVDGEQLQHGPATVASTTSESVVCHVSGDGQMVLVDPSEPGPVFVTVETVKTHHNTAVPPGTDVNFLAVTQSQQTTCSLYEGGGQTNIQPPASLQGTVGGSYESRSRRPCHCTRSQCLKLYCECFAGGMMCSNCDCSNCCNNINYELKRRKAILTYLDRNPTTFRPKIAGGKSGSVKGWHSKGCGCKRSGCLKNYCECYEANISCSSSCKCVGCQNYSSSSSRSQLEPRDKKKGQLTDGFPGSIITPSVVMDVCSCLMSQAEVAEMESMTPTMAERLVLNEFGRCLSHIVKTLFRTGPY